MSYFYLGYLFVLIVTNICAFSLRDGLTVLSCTPFPPPECATFFFLIFEKRDP